MKSITLVILTATLAALSSEYGEAKPKPFIPFNFWLNVSRQGPPPPPPPPLVFTSAAYHHNVPVVIGPPLYIKTVSTFTRHDDKANSTTNSSDASSHEDTTYKPSAIKGYNITTNFHTKVTPIKHESSDSHTATATED